MTSTMNRNAIPFLKDRAHKQMLDDYNDINREVVRREKLQAQSFLTPLLPTQQTNQITLNEVTSSVDNFNKKLEAVYTKVQNYLNTSTDREGELADSLNIGESLAYYNLLIRSLKSPANNRSTKNAIQSAFENTKGPLNAVVSILNNLLVFLISHFAYGIHISDDKKRYADLIMKTFLAYSFYSIVKNNMNGNIYNEVQFNELISKLNTELQKYINNLDFPKGVTPQFIEKARKELSFVLANRISNGLVTQAKSEPDILFKQEFANFVENKRIGMAGPLSRDQIDDLMKEFIREKERTFLRDYGELPNKEDEQKIEKYLYDKYKPEVHVSPSTSDDEEDIEDIEDNVPEAPQARPQTIGEAVEQARQLEQLRRQARREAQYAQARQQEEYRQRNQPNPFDVRQRVLNNQDDDDDPFGGLF